MDDDEMCRRFAEQDGYTGSLAEEWAGEEELELAGEVAADEFRIRYTPTHEAWIERGDDRMYVAAYANLARVVIVAPRRTMALGTEAGCIREIPVGWRDMANAEALLAYFNACVRSYEMMGWRRA
jgi:hypothetical protein